MILTRQAKKAKVQRDRLIFLFILALFLCGGLLIGARYYYPEAYAALKEESQAHPSSSTPSPESDRIYLGAWYVSVH